MACSQSSLKESGILAPIGYYTLHAILLSGVIVSTSVLRDLDNLPYVISFWVVIVATCGLYLALRFKDPGFVPYDAVFFTDQDQGPMNSVGNRNNSKSMGSKVELHPHHSHANASIQSHNVESKIVDERISIQSSNREKSIDIEPSLRPSLSDLKLPDKSKSSVNRNNSPGSEEIQCDNISENKKGNIGIPAPFHRDADVVACEPSVEDDEPFDYNPGTLTMDENNENDGSVIDEHQRRLQAETSILGTLPNNIEERDNGSGSLNSTKPHDHYNKSVTQFSHDIEAEIRHNENNYPLKELNGNDLIKRQEFFEHSCDIQFQTGDDDENKRVNMEEIKAKENRVGEVNVHKRPNHLNKNVILYKLQEKKFCSPKREIENIDVQSVERVITKENEPEIKDTAIISVEEGGTKQQENRDSTKIEVNESYKNVKEDAGEVVFVERRYCIICNIEQPIRSKHCRNCDKCVARYDHHCPWIGTCIGEKNHQLFFWFIVFQLVELAWADIELIRNIVNDVNDVGPSIGRIILAIILSGFALFVTSLLVFQIYLIFSNLTTWEKLSWNKITYMKEWNKKWGSPFSKGVRQNLLYFFLKSKKELRRWRLPKITTKDPNNSIKSC